jgi:hypothetical protein
MLMKVRDMNFKFPYKNWKPEDLIRRCGYGRIESFHTGKTSYKRGMAASGYPRFHAYIEEQPGFFEISLHLDQKKASYEGNHAHSGDYDSEVVADEARRITAMIAEIYGMQI